MKPLVLLAATTLSATLALPALAQDRPETSTPATEEEPDHATMDHSHGLDTAKVGPDPAMPAMDHSQMPGMNQGPTDHTGSGHSMADGPVEASGTSRLPQAEGMMPGLHFDLGGGWMGMAHGYPVSYTHLTLPTILLV